MSFQDFLLNAPYNAFFLVYILIACNFLAEMLGCKLQALLRESMIAKHIVGLSLIMFLIIFAEPSIRDTGNYLMGIVYSIVLYVWFVMTTKTHIYVTLIIIMMFISLYFLQLWKDSLKENDKEQHDQIETAQVYVTIMAFIITVSGVSHYFLLKRAEYKNDFDILTFFMGRTRCNNDPIGSLLSQANKSRKA